MSMKYLEVSLDEEGGANGGSRGAGASSSLAVAGSRRSRLLTVASVGAAAVFIATLPALLMLVPPLRSLNAKSGQMLDVMTTYVLGGGASDSGGSALEAVLAEMLAADGNATSTYAKALMKLKESDCVRFGPDVMAGNATTAAAAGDAPQELPLALHFCPHYGEMMDPEVLLELPRSYHGRLMKIIAHARSGPSNYPMINEGEGTLLFMSPNPFSVSPEQVPSFVNTRGPMYD